MKSLTFILQTFHASDFNNQSYPDAIFRKHSIGVGRHHRMNEASPWKEPR